MKLVMEYDVGDGCTFEATRTVCFEYDSLEAAYSDFVDKVRDKRKEKNGYTIEFCNHKFDISYFRGHKYNSNEDYDVWPEFYTLDGWWESKKNP